MLSDFELRALRKLATYTGLIGPGSFGDDLWGSYRGSACSAPYARQAGKVLNRLREHKLAEYVVEGGSWGWRITSAGRRALKAAAS